MIPVLCLQSWQEVNDNVLRLQGRQKADGNSCTELQFLMR